jgi:prepilin-type N-terminal cleavage/methylation domain-containing protein
MSAARETPCIPASTAARSGFTLIELLMVLAIVAILTSLILGATSLMRSRARDGQARAMIAGLVAALETYSAEDPRKRYPLHDTLFVASPPPAHELGMSPLGPQLPDGVLGMLADRKLFTCDSNRLDGQQRLLDPWGTPYRYHLKRPQPAQGAAQMSDWNWDPANTRERRWNQATNAAAPFPYVWSLGSAGNPDDAKDWLHDPR